METIRQEPQSISGRLDEEFDLGMPEDEAEVQAIEHALQSKSERLLFLTNEEDQNLLAYRLDGSWEIRLIPDSLPHEKLSKFMNYIIETNLLLQKADRGSEFGDYYSLRPLIYGGKFWLNSVCRQEFHRYQSFEGEEFLSILIIPWKKNWSLFELAESVRRGDRIGYFDEFLGILLPFTGKQNMQNVIRRLANNFDIPNVTSLIAGDDFKNIPELKNEVEQLL